MCINQRDTAERSSQVRIMGDIYESCTRNLIWLGECPIQRAIVTRGALECVLADMREATDNYSNVEDYLYTFHGGFKRASVGFPELKQLHLQALMDLYSRTWFRRLWYASP